MSEGFSIVLPSNACAEKHPDNTANKFIVSWENPIEFHDADWKVALTEANFNYTMSSLNTNYGITYEYANIVTFDYHIKVGNSNDRNVLSIPK